MAQEGDPVRLGQGDERGGETPARHRGPGATIMRCRDDGNVLCLGERVTGPELAIEIARAFLRAQFSDQERHRRRVGKVAAIEARWTMER